VSIVFSIILNIFLDWLQTGDTHLQYIDCEQVMALILVIFTASERQKLGYFTDKNQ